jgi:hypothetical protein
MNKSCGRAQPLHRWAFAAAGAAMLAACANNPPQTMLIQQETAHLLGLASTDELSIGNIERNNKKVGDTSLNLSSSIAYQATTARGRVFNCSADVVPGLLPGMPDKYTRIACGPATAADYKVNNQ